MPFLMRWPGRIPAGTVCREMATGMDVMPTLSSIGGGSAPSDRIIDGHDISPLAFAETGAVTPWDEFFYYKQNSLEAVRSGKWKLHVRKGADELQELYDIATDVGETVNVYGKHPEIVADLLARIEACRRDIGDEATGVIGKNVRPIGRVDNPKPLTVYDPNHPYIIAMYDKYQRG